MHIKAATLIKGAYGEHTIISWASQVGVTVSKLPQLPHAPFTGTFADSHQQPATMCHLAHPHSAQQCIAAEKAQKAVCLVSAGTLHVPTLLLHSALQGSQPRQHVVLNARLVCCCPIVAPSSCQQQLRVVTHIITHLNTQ